VLLPDDASPYRGERVVGELDDEEVVHDDGGVGQ